MSVRTLCMNTYSIYFYLLLVIESVLFVITFKRYVKFVVMPRRNEFPVVANTFAKYAPVPEKDNTWLQ
jgi:hypothetical protein